MFHINFSPQNIPLDENNQVPYTTEPVSPPRMNFEYEDTIPVPLSPLMSSDSSEEEEENEEDELQYERVFGNNSREYLEPSLPEHLLIHQTSEYIEPFIEHSCHQAIP